MAGSTRDITLRIREIREGKAFAEAAGDLEHVDKTISKTSKDTEELGKSTGKLNDELGKTDKATRGLSESAGGLNKEIGKTEEKVGGLGKEVDKTSKSAGRLGDEVNKTGEELGKAGKELDKFGKSGGGVSKAADDTKGLNRVLKESESELEKLNKEFAKTGNFDLFKGIRKQRSSIRQIRSVFADLEEESGIAFAKISEVWESLSGKLLPIIIGVGVAAAPLLGGVIAGGLTTGVIGAGLAGGILSATHDSRVKSAISEFGHTISSGFFQGSAFVGPIQSSLKILENTFSRLDLTSVFAKVAPYLTRVVEGISEMVGRIMPGLNAAFDRAGPFVEAFSDGLANTGDAISSLLEDISSSEGAIIALRGAFELLDKGIAFTGNAINILSDVLGATEHIAAGFFAFLAKIPGPLQSVFAWTAREAHKLLDVSGPTAEAIKVVGTAATESAAQLDSMRQSAIALTKESFSLEAAQDDVANAVAKLSKQVHEQRSAHAKGAGALRGHTQAARDNRAVVRELVDKYGTLIDTSIRLGHSADGLRGELENELVKMGFARNEAHRYANALTSLKAKLDAIHSKEVNIWVRQHYAVSGTALGEHSGLRISETQGRAAGGPVVAGVPYRINERGMETVTFPASGRVHPASLTPAMSSGGNTYNINVTLGPVGNLRDVGSSIVEAIRTYERSNGTRWRT